VGARDGDEHAVVCVLLRSFASSRAVDDAPQQQKNSEREKSVEPSGRRVVERRHGPRDEHHERDRDQIVAQRVSH